MYKVMAKSTSNSFHDAELQHHCQVCAKTFAEKEYKYSCSEHSDLLKVLGVDTAKDRPHVHPTFFCNLCYVKTQKSKKNG